MSGDATSSGHTAREIPLRFCDSTVPPAPLLAIYILKARCQKRAANRDTPVKDASAVALTTGRPTDGVTAALGDCEAAGVANCLCSSFVEADLVAFHDIHLPCRDSYAGVQVAGDDVLVAVFRSTDNVGVA